MARPVRVVVDGRALWDGSERRGVGRYLDRVLTHLATESDLEVTALVTVGTAVPDGVRARAVRRPATYLLGGRLAHRLGPGEHDVRLARELAREQPDVVWSPAQDPPRRSPAPVVQTLHDLIPLTHPDPRSAAAAARWRRRAERVRDAAALVAVSRATADDAVRILGVDPGRIRVVPNGVDSAFVPAGDKVDDRPYVLIVSSWGPHKGFGGAADVLDRLADAGYPHVLRVAGFQDEWMRAQLAADIRAARHADRVEVLGYVPDLPALYRGAAVVLVPSRAEGFGLPALEAMACGVPVVAFANSSLVEVVADAGVLVPDGDAVAMASRVGALLDDEHARRDLSARGVARASGFTWARTAAGVAEVLRAAAARQVA